MKNFTIFVFLLFFNFLFSQNSCLTTGFIAHTSNFERPGNPGPVDPDSTKPYVLNVFFTLIKSASGTTVIDNSHELDTPEQVENKFLECVRILNVRFTPYHIYFKYIGYKISYADVATQSVIDWSVFQPFKEPDTMNLYFVNNVPSVDPTVSAAVIGGTESVYSIYTLDSYPSSHEVLDRSLVHQVGHNLSLYHTYETGSHFQNSGNQALIDATQCERVSRIPSADVQLYNADIAGDEVTDTPAQKDISEELFPLDCGPWVPYGTNCYMESYPNDVYKNYMNIRNLTADTTCPWVFTPNQILKMRSFIKNNITDYGYLLGTESARTDVSALYEPFATAVIPGAIVSITDQPDNGGALVCRGQLYHMRFQPGLNWEFSDTTSGTVFQNQSQQFNYDNAFDHAIGVKITSISDNIVPVGVISGTNVLCVFEPYVSGTVYSMAVLGSMNITVKELDLIAVTNPRLYETLMQQYYYILKKYTASGVKFEQTFYKY